jgi:hypothetical protein
VDGRVNPRITVRGQDGGGSEASWKQPTNSYRYKSQQFLGGNQKLCYLWTDDRKQ